MHAVLHCGPYGLQQYLMARFFQRVIFHLIFQVDDSMPPPPPEATAPQPESKPPMQRLESADILPPAPPPAIPPPGETSADDPLPAPPAEMDHISDKLTTGLATDSICSVSFW